MVEKKYLLDSDVLIAMLRDRKDFSGIRRKILNVGIDRCCCSAVSVAELSSGAYRMGTERGLFEVSFIQGIMTVVPFGSKDSQDADIFGKTKALLMGAGTPVDDMDLLIASTALANDMTLVTHNIRHFSKVPGLKIEDWLNL
ncbi:MAG: type II toxin-antitoxin system VapC family toxin [Bacteroidales bacterium]|nr:type II toxin-antitoxin system VapC family toxin [Bacteroidales bacterium]